MTTILIAIASAAWPYVLGGLALIFGAWKMRESGAKAERAKQAAQETKARDVADEIDDAIAGRSAADNRKELGKWSRKP